MTTSTIRAGRGEAGFSLIELIVGMGILTIIMGVALGGLADAMKANESVLQVTGMNNTLRAGMDIMVRDLLQVGSGLPPGHVIAIPFGSGSQKINIPGPPGTAFTNNPSQDNLDAEEPTDDGGDTDIAAVVPGPGKGPTINGVKTDTITVLTEDNNLTDIKTTAVTNTSVTLSTLDADGNPLNIATGPDRVTAGQLMMIEKGSYTTLVQVTAVNTSTRVLTFGSDSLNLNQTVASGTLRALNAAPPANSPANTKVTRIRMISYYLDTTSGDRPRLVRRINNGDPVKFDNTLGTAVALDVENLTFSYDLDNADNTTNVRFEDADFTASGACAPEPCELNQIRKVNITLMGRSSNQVRQVHRNTLTSQVSLRGMAFVDEYKAPKP